ncbi:MAG: metalloregulator ArsR/SmtB family transcription factor [Tissierellia bacterium]|nr:metalloregulator ArsR/SmtB family transcription factor [Tissierellia bacterium]
MTSNDTDLERLHYSAEWLKALAHPMRLCIVQGLIKESSCSVNYIREILGLPQSTVSQHLQVLRHAGIVKGAKTGTMIHYSISDDRVIDLLRIIELA